MNVLLSSKTDAKEKQRVLQEEFHIAMTVEIESEVSELCNLSQGIYNEGRQEGLSEGLREGHREGLREGREEGIRGAIEFLRESGLSDKIILEKIMAKYHLTLEAAEKYVLASEMA